MKNVSGDERNFFESSDVRNCRVDFNLDGAKINSEERISLWVERYEETACEFLLNSSELQSIYVF